MNDLTDAVAGVVRRHLPEDRAGAALGGGVELADAGLDSVRIVGLMVDIERTFAVSFPDEDLDPATFRTVLTIAATVDRLRGRR